MKRLVFIFGATIVGTAALVLYFEQLPPEGLEPMGDDATVAWITLAAAVVSLLAALVGLIQTLMALRVRER